MFEVPSSLPSIGTTLATRPGVLTVGVIYVLAALGADLLTVRLNPRLRFGGAA